MRPEIKAETIRRKSRVDTKSKDPVHSGHFDFRRTTHNSEYLLPPQNVGAVGVLLTWQPGIGGRSVTTLPEGLTPKKQARTFQSE